MVSNQPTPFDGRLKREVALLLHLNEVTVPEILELYQLSPEDYRPKLYVWKHRAGKRYDKLDVTAQDIARGEALKRFYGVSGAAAKIAAETASQAPEELVEPVEELSDFIDSLESMPVEPPEVLPVENLTESVSSSEMELAKPCTESAMIPESNVPRTLQYEDTLQNVAEHGLKTSAEMLKTLQNLAPDIFDVESKVFDNIIKYLRELKLQGMKVRDVKTYVETFEKVLTLRRKALILPFGSIDPNKQHKDNSSKHLHFHNHGLQSFNPHKD